MRSWTAYSLFSSGRVPKNPSTLRDRSRTQGARFRRVFLSALLMGVVCPGPVLPQEQARPPAGPDDPVPSTAVAPDWNSLTRLGEKSVATAIRLSDGQQASVTEILTTRDAALATASETTRAGIEADAVAKLKALLSDEQQRLYIALFSGNRLKFNFRLQKWPEVLDWFADEAGLSLVMDEPPPGTFNYSDTKEYTTTEAINLLNGWLLIKGYTLVRRERLLMCVSLKEGLPEGAIPRVSLDELALRGRFEFVSVLFPLEGRQSETVVSEVTPLLGTYGKVQPLPSTSQILISGTAGTLREVIKIARLVPVPKTATPKKPEPPPKPVLTVYPIEHANPQRAGEVLKQIVNGTVLVDETAKQISINAIPAEQDKAKIIITQLESNQGPDRQSELQLYALRSASSSESLATLQLIIPDAQYRYDDAAQKLVVWATPGDQLRVAGALRKLETEQSGRGATQLQVYRLKQATPDAVQTLITTLLPDVSLTTDARTQSLIAIGTLTEHQAIAALLEQLEPGAPNSDEKELRVYPLAGLNPETVTELLSALAPRAQITQDTENKRLLVMAADSDHLRIAGLLEQMAAVPAAQPELKTYAISPEDTGSVTGLLASLAPDAQVTHDEPNDRLVVVAVEEDHRQIADILQRITATDDGGQIIRSYPAQGVDVSSVTALLQTLAPKASVTTDTTHDRFLIVASKSDQATVENVLSQVVVENPQGEPTLKSYAIAPQVTLTTLTTLLTGLAPEAKITSDEPNRRMLIVASTKDHGILQAAIQQVETDAGGELPELKFYPLTKSEGANAVSVLQTLAPEALITHDEMARRLSVVATKTAHAAIAATLVKLEAATPESEKRVLKIHEVTATQQSRFAGLLTSLQTELPGMQLITDAEPDELAIWATPSQQDTVTQILAQLKRDVPPEQKRRLIVYPITKTDPTGVSDILKTLFPNTQITIDEKASRLMIHARPAEHVTIRSAIEQLDSDIPVEKEIKLMAYPVQGLNATVALDLIQAELPELTVIQDTTAETLIVRTTLRQHQRVAELLDALRTTSTFGKTRSLVVYPLVFPSGSLATSFMTSAFPDARLFPDEENRRMTVWATPPDHERLRSAITDITGTGTDGTGSRLERYPLTAISQSDLTPLLSQVVPQAHFVFDSDNAALIAWGRDHEHVLIGRLFSQLSESDTSESRLLKTFSVLKPGATLAQEVLSAVVPEVSFLDSGNPDTLLAWVTTGQQQLIETSLQQLSETNAIPTTRTLKFYPVAPATISDIQTVLDATVSSVTFTATSDNSRLMARVTPAEDEKILATLRQLSVQQPFRTERSLLFYSIASAGPQATDVLSRAVPAALINTGSRPGQLMIEATVDEHTKVAALLKQLTAAQQDSERSLQIYEIGKLGAESDIRSVLAAAVPDVSFTASSDGERLLGSVLPTEHQKIQDILKQLTATRPFDSQTSLAVYSIFGLGADARAVLEAAVPDADINAGASPHQLLVVARAEDHAKIKQVIGQLNSLKGPPRPKTLQVYELGNVDPDAVREVLRPLVDADVQLTVDPTGRRLFVRAFADRQAAIGQIVKQVQQNIVTRKGVTTQAYFVGNGNADEAQQAMQVLFPEAILAIDEDSKLLVATALPEEQKTISEVVDQMSGGANPGDRPVARNYTLPRVSSKQLIRVFGELFSGRDGVRFVTDTETGTMIAVAPARHHDTIQQLIEQFQASEEAAPQRSVEFYSLTDTDEAAAETLVRNLLEELDPQAKIVREGRSRQLVVTAFADSHTRVETLLGKLRRPDDRELEVLQLNVLEPNSARTAISSLFFGNNAPQVQTEEDSQQLLIRATQSQLEDIRRLLSRMGETGLTPTGSHSGSGNSGKLRIIPLGGHSRLEIESAVERIEQIWPRLRKNPIRIIRPGAETDGPQDGQFSVPPEKPADASDGVSQETGSQSSEQDKTQSQAVPVHGQVVPEPETAHGEPATAGSTRKTDPAPVVIVPGEGRLTVASDDTEALNQMETLLRTVFSQAGHTRGRDFTIYALRNAGAGDVAETLNTIFQQEQSITTGTVIIVPEERLNALIVFAGRSDRSRLESLIEALDSERTPDSLTASVTRVIPVEHASAVQVSSILSGIYKSQMIAGGSRQSVSIPEGVSSDVASVLRQINAAASSPLLTVQTQSATNSLIVKAPLNLLDEVEALIHQLDEATVRRARRVTLIPLRRSSSRRILETLGRIVD